MPELTAFPLFFFSSTYWNVSPFEVSLLPSADSPQKGLAGMQPSVLYQSEPDAPEY